jgi:hypothetical protein
MKNATETEKALHLEPLGSERQRSTKSTASGQMVHIILSSFKKTRNNLNEN